VLLVYGALFWPFYFSGRYLPTHDYHEMVPAPHMVMNYLVNGHLPLWGPELNCGAPLWPDVEVYPAFDPVSLAVGAVAALAGGSIAQAHLVTMFLWHVAFAAGGLLLFHRLGTSARAACFGFAVLLFSSLSGLNFRQGGYVTVCRWVPLALHSLIAFLEAPGAASSVRLGLLLGMSIAGYHTPHIAVILAFALLAAAPIARHARRNLVAQALPGLLIALSIGLPFLVAARYWVGNIAMPRLTHQAGYRGSVMDVVGPLVGVYADETVISLGIVTLLLAVGGVARLVALEIAGRGEPYWPRNAALCFGALVWVFYLGTQEVIRGINQPFLWIRSFHIQLPFVVLVIAYFAADGLDHLLGVVGEAKRLRAPVALALSAILVASVFAEVARPSLLTITMNFPPEVHPPFRARPFCTVDYLSFRHWGFAAIAAAWCAGLLAGVAMRSRSLVAGCLLVAALGDAYLVNRRYLKIYGAQDASSAANPWGDWSGAPAFRDRMPAAPPPTRARIYSQGSTYFWKQGPVLHHSYSASTRPLVAWFQMRGYHEFQRAIQAGDRFDRLAGVSRPLVSFPTRLHPVEPGGTLAALGELPVDDLDSTIVVSRDEVPPDHPREVPAGPQPRWSTIAYGPNHATFRIETPAPRYMLYRDSHTPDWVASIDGRPVALLRANQLFKAVLVPAGAHTVELRYRPWAYIAGFWARLGAYVVGLALLVWLRPWRHGAGRARTA
jgi:hypothetical protein